MLVEWEDSQRPLSPWQWIDEYQLPAAVQCVSVGFLIAKTEQALALVIASVRPSCFRYCCCSGTVGLLVVVSYCAPKPPLRGRGRGIGRRDRVVSALRTVPPS